MAENAFLNGDQLLHKLQLFGILLWGFPPVFSLSFLTVILLPGRLGALRVTCQNCRFFRDFTDCSTQQECHRLPSLARTLHANLRNTIKCSVKKENAPYRMMKSCFRILGGNTDRSSSFVFRTDFPQFTKLQIGKQKQIGPISRLCTLLFSQGGVTAPDLTIF